MLPSNPAYQAHPSLPGGIVLWSRSFTPAATHTAASSASPVNSLVREALIEGRGSDGKYEKDGYAVKWTFVNDLELIFVVRVPLAFTRPTYSYRQLRIVRSPRSRISGFFSSLTSMNSSRHSRPSSSSSSSLSSLLSLPPFMSPVLPSHLSLQAHQHGTLKLRWMAGTPYLTSFCVASRTRPLRCVTNTVVNPSSCHGP